MDGDTARTPVLARFVACIAAMYGDRLRRVVLYGSRARGDARPDSDYDIAVFLDAVPKFWDENRRLADLGLAFLDETGELINALPFPIERLHDDSPLMHEIRRDGIDL